MAAAIALSERGRGRTAPNPNVSCIIVRDGRIAGRGWTQPGGRPHAEAMALMQAGELARGATAHVTLETFFPDSPRGPTCSHLLIEACGSSAEGASHDPDYRTSRRGHGGSRESGN